jgi:predicted metal-dependent phosphoesterase TrpH
MLLFGALATGATAQETGGAWYRGDLHAHSTYSDGDSTVAEVIAAAERRGLDFFAITDHDTSMGGAPRQWDDPGYRSDRMVLLYGVEWTTSKGHANVLAAQPFPYGELWAANRSLDAEAAVRIAHELGALFSINHPRTEYTSAWELEVPASVDAVEVWNAPYGFPSNNRVAVAQFYESLLRSGRRITAVAGSDSHVLRGLEIGINPPGHPTTWVYAPERSASGVIAGIKAGHVSLSYAPYGDRLELSADADGDGRYELMAGDVIPLSGQPVTIRAQIRRMDARQCSWCLIYRNGKVVKRALLQGSVDAVSWSDTPEPGTCYRAELRGSPRVGVLAGLLSCSTLALTNPLYVGVGGGGP